MRRSNLTSCSAMAALLLALASVTAARVIHIDADATGADNAGGANGDTAITVTASALKDIYDPGEQVPLVVTIVNYSEQPVYIYIDEDGFLRQTITVKDKDGVTIIGGPAATPPPPPRHYWVEIDGKKVFVVPVKEIGPGQTVTAVIPDVLRGYHGHLQEGTYYLAPRDLSVIHDVGFIMERDDVPHPLWIDPSTVISEAKYKVNTIQIWLRRAIVYVDVDGAGANDGSSWADAYNYLQDALADANSSEKPVEIRVAQGIYKPDQGANQTPGDRQATFQLINGVIIKGGYAGFSKRDPNARDIDRYETLLSGDLNGDDLKINDIRDLFSDLTRADNSYHVVTGSGTDATAALDSCTVTSGNANSSLAESDSAGAGMYNYYGSPKVINCIFINNIAPYGGGGGIYNYGSSPTITNCTVTMNWALSGAGISCSWGGTPMINNCRISSNSAIGYGGGGICCERDCNPTIHDCIVTENTAEKYGGGIVCTFSSATITDCKICENWAWSYGGGIQSTGTTRQHGKSPMISKCLISGNFAWYGGGGIECSANSTTIENCTIRANSSLQYNGGGVYCDSSSPRIVNCTICSNRAHRDGGGVFLFGVDTSVEVMNCTFTVNSAGYAGGAIGGESNSSAVITNCILWADSAQRAPEICLRSAASLNVSYSNVRSGQAATYVYPGATLTWGDGNIDADPRFVDPNNGDYHLKSQAGRWDRNEGGWTNDEVTSPCIDAGDMGSPIGYESFPNGGVINMGAYGGTAEASKSYFGSPICETIVAGDINGDCAINFRDYTFMALHWLEDKTPAPPPPAPPVPPPGIR